LTLSWSSFFFLGPFATDELALLFTGSPAPPPAHSQLQQAHESSAPSELDDENGDGEDEGDCGAEDEVASPRIPLSLDSPSPTAPSGDDGSVHVSLRGPDVLGLAHPLFTATQLGVDRRLLVNRKRQLKMYRVWMQGKFQRTGADGLPLAMELDAGTS
jgi:tRNAThr (cytosine32-N3)-methyltransferase